MITTANAKTKTDDELAYARRDLREVIEIQEKANRESPGSCPKLGAYWDELCAVGDEIRRRATKKAIRRANARARHQAMTDLGLVRTRSGSYE